MCTLAILTRDYAEGQEMLSQRARLDSPLSTPINRCSLDPVTGRLFSRNYSNGEAMQTAAKILFFCYACSDHEKS